MTEPSLNQQLYNATAALAEANENLRLKRGAVDNARRGETHAMNAVNEAQKKFDALVALVKKGAPSDSDWKRPPQHPA